MGERRTKHRGKWNLTINSIICAVGAPYHIIYVMSSHDDDTGIYECAQYIYRYRFQVICHKIWSIANNTFLTYIINDSRSFPWMAWFPQIRRPWHPAAAPCCPRREAVLVCYWFNLNTSSRLSQVGVYLFGNNVSNQVILHPLNMRVNCLILELIHIVCQH